MNSLQAILGCLESSLPEGHPWFHDPSAHTLQYNPEGSSIFIIDYSTFLSMDPLKIQNIFRHRHILVSNAPMDNMEFDLKGLSSIGSLSKQISIQGNMNPSTSSWSCLILFQWGLRKVIAIRTNLARLVHSGTYTDLLKIMTTPWFWMHWTALWEMQVFLPPPSFMYASNFWLSIYDLPNDLTVHLLPMSRLGMRLGIGPHSIKVPGLW